MEGRVSTNCMVIHSNRYHHGSRDLTYKMEPTGVFNTALDRQLDESMRLKFSSASIILNSGSEWRGESIPRASFGPILPTLLEATQSWVLVDVKKRNLLVKLRRKTFDFVVKIYQLKRCRIHETSLSLFLLFSEISEKRKKANCPQTQPAI